MANVDYLRERAELLRATRRFFDEQGFVEVQPPCMARDCVVDAYLDPLTIDAKDTGLSNPSLPPRFYLQTSPESAMKRMLAAGAPSIYSICPVFRAGESGELHNIEFTMLEWYEVGGDFASAIDLTGKLISGALQADGFDTVTYRKVFQDALSVDPIDSPIDDLFGLVASKTSALKPARDAGRDDLLDILLSMAIAPSLGIARPLIVTDYPLTQAALAKQSPGDPQCASRFEAFVRGVELANGYDELRDAEILLSRYEANNRLRELAGKEALQVDTTLVEAMRTGLPACSGVAVGVDRLLMLQVGVDRLAQVMAFTTFNA